MKSSLLTLCSGMFLLGGLYFPGAGHQQQNRKQAQQKTVQRVRRADTPVNNSRIQPKNNIPEKDKTDSVPLPQPKPVPVPIPDTIH
jgi:hypothetical protein